MDKYISIQEAVKECEERYGSVTNVTIIEWTKRYCLGIKLGGRWKIDKERFKRFLKEGTYINKEN